ncbi:CARDB domain-containing protein [Hahella ganghwensis]|uniref:CARDB domain-containing protein n=1 Tax=Hahella ganghwensis TaxID=286420 RepID=UPI00036A540E|nr:CARDB domain-containing protein [Hahella ganghwensis]
MKILRYVSIALVITAFNVFADPIPDNVSVNYKVGWYPNYFQLTGPLTCPRTCRAWTGGRAESERSPYDEFERTYVCKSNNLIQPSPNDRDVWLYGNQFDDKTACFMGTPNEQVVVSERYYCLCVNGCSGPDLVVQQIYDPVWDSTTGESVIKVIVANVGNSSTAVATDARLVDPGTGASDTQGVGVLAPGATMGIKFRLGYWVFDPDAELHVTVDYSRRVDECDEDNNTLIYKKQG